MQQLQMTEFVFFWRGPFSQWVRYPMEVDGVRYVTCEQYMMAGKARLFNDPEKESEIMATSNPRDQQTRGKEVRGFVQSEWDAAREDIVYRGNLAKFSQHAELRDLLLATDDKVIAEASPTDRLWGIGMAEDDPNVADTSRWGKNLLGKALMRVRNTLRDEG